MWYHYKLLWFWEVFRRGQQSPHKFTAIKCLDSRQSGRVGLDTQISPYCYTNWLCFKQPKWRAVNGSKSVYITWCHWRNRRQTPQIPLFKGKMKRIQMNSSPSETLSRSHAAPRTGCCLARQPGWKLHLTDATLISGRWWLDNQHYLVGEGEQQYLGLLLTVERMWYEEGWYSVNKKKPWFWNWCSASHPNPHCHTQSGPTTGLWSLPCASRPSGAPSVTHTGSSMVLIPAFPRSHCPLLPTNYGVGAGQLQHCMCALALGEHIAKGTVYRWSLSLTFLNLPLTKI